MAVTVVSKTGLFDPDTRDKASIARVLGLATYGTGTRAQRVTARAMLARSMGRRGSDFQVHATTSNNDALAAALVLSGTTSEGVTFPANTVRTVRMEMLSTNDEDRIFQVIEQDVLGGTTPVLGDPKLVDAYIMDDGVYAKLGRVHLQANAAMTEVTDGMSNSGIAGGALSSSVSAITFPPSRALRIIGSSIAQDTSAAGTGAYAKVIDALGDAGSGTFDLQHTALDDGAAADAPTGQVDLAIELWPQAQIELALNTNDVEVHIRTTLSDVFSHRFDVEIGPAREAALSA